MLGRFVRRTLPNCEMREKIMKGINALIAAAVTDIEPQIGALIKAHTATLPSMTLHDPDNAEEMYYHLLNGVNIPNYHDYKQVLPAPAFMKWCRTFVAFAAIPHTYGSAWAQLTEAFRRGQPSLTFNEAFEAAGKTLRFIGQKPLLESRHLSPVLDFMLAYWVFKQELQAWREDRNR